MVRDHSFIAELEIACRSASAGKHDQAQLGEGTISEQLGAKRSADFDDDFAKAHRLVLTMHSKGELTPSSVHEFAKAGQFAKLTVALSLLCSTPLELIKALLKSTHREAVLIPCKAAGLDWPVVRLILNILPEGGAPPDHQGVDQARAGYLRLTKSGARRVLRFWEFSTTTCANGEGTTGLKLRSA